jgi:hypothetical protein
MLRDESAKSKTEISWKYQPISYSESVDEICVGGVFLRFFLRSPTSPLSKSPKEFMELLTVFVENSPDASEEIALGFQCISALLKKEKNLLMENLELSDSFLEKAVRQLKASPETASNILFILNQLSRADPVANYLSRHAEIPHLFKVIFPFLFSPSSK